MDEAWELKVGFKASCLRAVFEKFLGYRGGVKLRQRVGRVAERSGREWQRGVARLSRAVRRRVQRLVCLLKPLKSPQQ